MTTKKRNLIIISSIAVILLIIGTILLFSRLNNEEFNAHQSYIVECSLIDGDKSYEIRGYTDGYLYLYVDNKRKEKIKSYTSLSEQMGLLPEAGVEPVDITTLPVLMDLTWQSDITSSTGVVNNYKKEGYKVTRKFCNSKYIELFMTKDDSSKRIIITSTFIMQGDLNSESVLPSLQSYFDEYNIKYEF